MKLGLTDHERQVRDDARRMRNCFIAMLTIATAASILLTYFF